MEKTTEQLQTQQDPGPHMLNSEMCPLSWPLVGTKWSQQCLSTSSETPVKELPGAAEVLRLHLRPQFG